MPARVRVWTQFASLMAGLLMCSLLSIGQVAPTQDAAPSMPHNLYVKVRLDGKLNTSALKTGDEVRGVLFQPVYSGDHEVLPANSEVRLTVDHLERKKRMPNDHWPWVIQAFLPRHETYPAFRSAVVALPDGKEVPLQVSMISVATKVPARTQSRKGSASHGSHPLKSKAPMVMTLAATGWDGSPAPNFPKPEPAPVTLATGTGAKVILLGNVSASKNVAGDVIQARLVEPVRVGPTVVLPEGTLFEGKVVRSKPPRWLSRSGSLLLKFTRITLPGAENGNFIAASVTGAEVDAASLTRIDSEGELKGSPGKAWMMANVAVTGGIAKIADDGIQLLVEAISSTATDASTAGTGRIVALCASGIFMITRHGRDVMLPQFTEMNIMLDRPVSLNMPSRGSE
jgi:hypothetical protein